MKCFLDSREAIYIRGIWAGASSTCIEWCINPSWLN